MTDTYVLLTSEYDGDDNSNQGLLSSACFQCVHWMEYTDKDIRDKLDLPVSWGRCMNKKVNLEGVYGDIQNNDSIQVDKVPPFTIVSTHFNFVCEEFED